MASRRDLQRKRRNARRQRTRGYPNGRGWLAYIVEQVELRRGYRARLVGKLIEHDPCFDDNFDRQFWRSDPNTVNPMVGFDHLEPMPPPERIARIDQLIDGTVSIYLVPDDRPAV